MELEAEFDPQILLKQLRTLLRHLRIDHMSILSFFFFNIHFALSKNNLPFFEAF